MTKTDHECLMLPEYLVEDRFLGGRLRIVQPARGEGFRFNLDAVWLAAASPVSDVWIDLGAGSGIVGILGLAYARCSRVEAIERDSHMVEALHMSRQRNGLGHILNIVDGDIVNADLGTDVGGDLRRWAVCNPPYWNPQAGKISANDRERDARFDVLGMKAWFEAAQRFGCRGISMILPVLREAEFISASASLGWSLSMRVALCSREGKAAKRLVLGASADSAPVREERWILHVEKGRDLRPQWQAFVDGPQRLFDGMSADE